MNTGRKILVVDDDPSIREILSIQLTRLGYQVTTASDGLEAWRLRPTPDAILRPHDAAPRRPRLLPADPRRREEGRKRTPVLFLTARDSTHDKTSAALSGGDEFVPKPVSIQELSERLEAALLKKGKP
jgi:two-component system OmpR family response regulator